MSWRGFFKAGAITRINIHLYEKILFDLGPNRSDVGEKALKIRSKTLSKEYSLLIYTSYVPHPYPRR